MGFPNLSDLAATTIEHRSGKIADNVIKNNAGLAWIKKSGNVKTVPGGTQIIQELAFAENGNFGWYAGYDFLPMGPQDVISNATFLLKQAACSVMISGLEQLQNSGREAIIDLMDSRMSVAESTMANKMAEAFYSDGTGFGGKQITGLAAMVPASNTTGTYGGIDRSLWQFWQPQLQNVGANPTSANMQAQMNLLWAKTVRGQDRTKLILFDTNLWNVFTQTLQPLQRFVDTESANMGFAASKFMDADVVLDGGIGGFCPPWTGYFLNPKYIFFRPHKDRNMVPLSPSRRYALNQDAECQIIAWAGNITCSNQMCQGFFKGY